MENAKQLIGDTSVRGQLISEIKLWGGGTTAKLKEHGEFLEEFEQCCFFAVSPVIIPSLQYIGGHT